MPYISVRFIVSRSSSIAIARRTRTSSNGGRRMFIANPWNPHGRLLSTACFAIQLRTNGLVKVSFAIMCAE